MKQIKIRFLSEGELPLKAGVEIPITHTEPTPGRRDKRKKILLVDDDSAVRQILLRLLSEEGYFVVTAANEAEALEFAGVISFDLVLLDLSAPVKDGWEVFEQLYAENPFLAIILITTQPDRFDSFPGSGVGARLEKPLDLTKLFFTIHDLLEHRAEFRPEHGSGQARSHPHAGPACSISRKT